MKDEKFKATLVILVPMVVQQIVNNEKLDEVAATKAFYESELYALLENEQTKLWHLSPRCLYQMYDEEQQTGKITFPEGV